MKYVLMLLLIFSQMACIDKIRRTEIIVDKFQSLVPTDTTQTYFSSDTTPRDYESWANDVLFKLREPVLDDYSGDGEFIRFIWLRSFENPMVVRVNRFADTVYANIKELDISSDQRGIIKDTIIVLGKKEWDDFLRPLIQHDFWNKSSNELSMAKDGAIWYLESRANQHYRVLEEWDGGHLSSSLLTGYLKPLIDFASGYLKLPTEKGRPSYNR